jgi:hypothetical protein
MNDFETYNYQTSLEDTIELRKAVAKLEDLLMKKHTEYDNVLRIYDDLKQVHEKVKKECKDLNEKYIMQYDELKKQEKHHEADIQKLKSVNIN